MTASAALEQRLLAFQRGFDQVFAAAPIATVETFEDLLAVRIAGDPYALRVREIAGLVASRKIVPLPSPRAELLGVAGIRGELVAVYSLAALLGHAPDSKPPSWLVLARGVGLAVEELEGFLRVRTEDLHAARPGEGASPHLGAVARAGNQSRPVVDIPSMLGVLSVHTGVASPLKESSR